MIQRTSRSLSRPPTAPKHPSPINRLKKARKSITRRYQALSDVVRPVKLFPPAFGLEETEHDILDAKYDIESYASAFDSVEEAPDGYWVEKIEGQIPQDLCGTYFRNGPGQFDFVDEPVASEWDANGIIGSVAIKDGKAFFRSRFVKTKESMLEEKEGRRLFKGSFGTIPKHGVSPLRLLHGRNSGSGMTFDAKGKLYAPYEGSPVVEIDPFTLETLYPTLPTTPIEFLVQFLMKIFAVVGNWINLLAWRVAGVPREMNPRKLWGIADWKYDPRRNVKILHSYKAKVSPSTIGSEFQIYEIDNDSRLQAQQTYTLDSFSFGHAIGVSENYYVINKFPMEFDTECALDPTRGLVQCLKWNAYGDHEFHIIPRRTDSNQPSNKDAKIYKLNGTSFIYHFVNVFEDENVVIVDAIHYPRLPNYQYGPQTGTSYKVANKTREPEPRLRRTICYANGSTDTRELSTRCLELPTINPHYIGRPYRYIYVEASLHPSAYVEPQAIGKIDLETGSLDLWANGMHYFAGEPLFVPRADAVEEDDGWIMAFCYNGKTEKTEFVILDAKNISQGPVATLFLDHAVAHGFHGIWSENYFGPEA